MSVLTFNIRGTTQKGVAGHDFEEGLYMLVPVVNDGLVQVMRENEHIWQQKIVEDTLPFKIELEVNDVLIVTSALIKLIKLEGE